MFCALYEIRVQYCLKMGTSLPLVRIHRMEVKRKYNKWIREVEHFPCTGSGVRA